MERGSRLVVLHCVTSVLPLQTSGPSVEIHCTFGRVLVARVLVIDAPANSVLFVLLRGVDRKTRVEVGH